jgi:hypothetical protein
MSVCCLRWIVLRDGYPVEKILRVAELSGFSEALHDRKPYRRSGLADIQFRRPSSCTCIGERLPMSFSWKSDAVFGAIACKYSVEILLFTPTEQGVPSQSAAQLLHNSDRMLRAPWSVCA